MQIVSTPNGPAPAGHYSQAIVHQGTVYVAGQLPIVPADSEHRPGTIEDQTLQALANVDAILRAAGSDLQHALMVTIYVSNIELWDSINRVYEKVMGQHKPARAVVPTRELHFGYDLEIAVIAAVHKE